MSESDIRKLSADRADRILRNEFEGMVDAFYAEGATLMPAAASTLQGVNAIRAFWREQPDRGLVTLSLEARDVAVSGEMAYEIGRFNRTLRPRHGAPFQEHGKYVVIYRRQPAGEWRAEAEMYNSDAPR